MAQVGNVGIGEMFLYNGSLFVVMPFDWEDEKYYNLCIATRNHDDYETGSLYWLDEKVEVVKVPNSDLKDLIPKEFKKVLDESTKK